MTPEIESILNQALVGGIPITLIVMLVVQQVKAFGVRGNALRGVAIGLGLFFGASYQVAINGVPADFSAVFSYAVFAFACALAPMKTYDLGETVAEKAAASAAEKTYAKIIAPAVMEALARQTDQGKEPSFPQGKEPSFPHTKE